MFDRDDDARLKRIEGAIEFLTSERLESISSSLVRIEAKLDKLKPMMTEQDVDNLANQINSAADKLDSTAKP